MITKITDNWEVELINDRGDTLTLKGEWYADFFKEYDNKQLIIADVVGQSEQLPNMTLEQAIAKAKPNLDKITDVDKHLDNIR